MKTATRARPLREGTHRAHEGGSRLRAFGAVSTLLLSFALFSGCSSFSRAGYGDRGTFSDGVLTTRFEENLGVVYEVTVRALADLGVTVRHAAKEETAASIHATRNSDLAPITIDFRWRRHDTTGAFIRAGVNGDEACSREIERAISSRLLRWRQAGPESVMQGRTLKEHEPPLP